MIEPDDRDHNIYHNTSLLVNQLPTIAPSQDTPPIDTKEGVALRGKQGFCRDVMKHPFTHDKDRTIKKELRIMDEPTVNTRFNRGRVKTPFSIWLAHHECYFDEMKMKPGLTKSAFTISTQ